MFAAWLGTSLGGWPGPRMVALSGTSMGDWPGARLICLLLLTSYFWLDWPRARVLFVEWAPPHQFGDMAPPWLLPH